MGNSITFKKRNNLLQVPDAFLNKIKCDISVSLEATCTKLLLKCVILFSRHIFDEINIKQPVLLHLTYKDIRNSFKITKYP